MSSLIFNKVVIYGYKLYQGELSNIFNGFYRAFKYLRYNTYWYDDEDNLNGIDFTNTLFLVEGCQDSNIPIRNDCTYILYNCNDSKYDTLPMINILRLNVYAKDVLNKSDITSKTFFPTIYYIINQCKIYIPWATPLLPPEIQKNMEDLVERPILVKDQACYIGTICQNIQNINKVSQTCKKNNIEHVCKNGKMSIDDYGILLKSSKYPIALVDDWEKTNNYISHKVFEHISWCGYSITNSLQTYNILNQKICYDDDPSNLITVAIPYVENLTLLEKLNLMQLVKDNHTYVSRIRIILQVIFKIRKQFT